MKNDISDTGFWASETAHIHHVNSNSLANWICNYLQDYKSKILYDFGCGMGFYLEKLRQANYINLKGFEGDPPKQRFFKNIDVQDLSIPFFLNEKGNVISLEVIEHIPKQFEKIVLKNISNNCDGKLIFSWAIENQAGYGHVNCKNNDYAIKSLEEFGFKFLEKDTVSSRSINLDEAPWFNRTLLIFEKI